MILQTLLEQGNFLLGQKTTKFWNTRSASGTEEKASKEPVRIVFGTELIFQKLKLLYNK